MRVIDVCAEQLEAMKEEWEEYWHSYKNLRWGLALVVMFVYGLRIIQDNIFIDSEIMILYPDKIWHQWISVGRFGLVLTGILFNLGRLVPFLSSALMALMMWLNGLLLSFGVYIWSGRSKRYQCFLYLFPALFVSSPLFAEQYLFLLQAFEISYAIGLCIAAAICTGRFVYEDGSALWLIPGFICMVWSFGSYQVMLCLYICLVLVSFVINYMNGKSRKALEYGIKHVAIFISGILMYFGIAQVMRIIAGEASGYVSDQIYWKSNDVKTCFSYIKMAISPILKGENIYFHKLYLPSLCLFEVQAIWHGWKKKAGYSDYGWYLLSNFLLLLSPFFLIFVSGGVLPLRTQMVYPVSAAFFLAHLTVLPPEECKRRLWTCPAAAFAIICVFQVFHLGQASVQLFQTSYEVYRNDVMTANRIYEDICQVVGEHDIKDYQLIFTGGRSPELPEPAARGELIGLSFFDAEAHTSVGVTGRVNSLFMILGFPIGGSGNRFSQNYESAIAYMDDAPNWPKQGSIRIMGEDVVVIRLGGQDL